jgi:hypothetical protein
MRRHDPRKRRVLSALVAAGCGVAALSGSAQAVDVIVCDGAQTDTYTPALTLTRARTTVTSDYLLGACVAPTDLDVTGGIASETYTAELACVQVLTILPQRRYTITWNTGRTSELTFQPSINLVLGRSLSYTDGLITAGAFRGTTVVATAVLFTNPLDCTGSSGVTNAHGTTTFTGI